MNDSNFALPTSTFNSSTQHLISPVSDGYYSKPNLSNAQDTHLVLPTLPLAHAMQVPELGKDLATPTITQSWMELDESETVRSKSNPKTFGLDMEIDIA